MHCRLGGHGRDRQLHRAHGLQCSRERNKIVIPAASSRRRRASFRVIASVPAVLRHRLARLTDPYQFDLTPSGSGAVLDVGCGTAKTPGAVGLDICSCQRQTQVDFGAGTRARRTNAVWHLKELALSAFSSPRATLHASQEPHRRAKEAGINAPRCASLAASASVRKTIPLSPEGRRRATASRERLEAASTRARSGRGALVGDRSAARRPLFSGTDTVTVAAVCSLRACCKHGRDAGTCSAPYDEQTRATHQSGSTHADLERTDGLDEQRQPAAWLTDGSIRDRAAVSPAVARLLFQA